MSKLTLEEKRLRQIKQQLFGKDSSSPSKKKFAPQTLKVDAQTMQVADIKISSPAHIVGENVYLKNDLLKIVFLTASVLFIQFILYYGAQMKLIHLGF